MDTGATGITRICRAGIIIIAVFGRVNARAIYRITRIDGTGIAVVTGLGGVGTGSGAQIAGIGGAGFVIITIGIVQTTASDGRAHTLPCRIALVGVGAVITIGTGPADLRRIHARARG
jgi:hypothetical protein